MKSTIIFHCNTLIKRLIYRYTQVDRNGYFHFNEFANIKSKGLQGRNTKRFQADKHFSKIEIEIFKFMNPLVLSNFVKFEGVFKDHFL